MRRLAALILLVPLSACGAATELDYHYAPKDTFCSRLSPRPLFCDDFDDGTLTKWSESTGDVTVTNADDTSPPNALRVVMGQADAQTLKVFEGRAFTHITLSFAINADDSCGTAQVVSLESLGDHGEVAFSVAFALSNSVICTGLPCSCGGLDRLEALTLSVARVPSGKWSRVQIDVDFGGVATVTTITDGVTTPATLSLRLPDHIDSPTITLGLASGGAMPCDVLIDDFVFDGR